MIKNLPNLLYNIGSKSLDPDFLYVKNIWRRAEILTEFKAQISLFDEENVQDGERPEDIATRFYRKTQTGFIPSYTDENISQSLRAAAIGVVPISRIVGNQLVTEINL